MESITRSPCHVRFSSSFGEATKSVDVSRDASGKVTSVKIDGFNRYTRDADDYTITQQDLDANPKLRDAVEQAVSLSRRRGPDADAITSAAFKGVYQLVDSALETNVKVEGTSGRNKPHG